MNDIKQLTNFDITEAETRNKVIDKGGDKGQTIIYPYKVIDSSLLGSNNIHKLGYCVNNNQGINYPIFLKINGIETEFQIGKTGMFEFQEEEWRDVNDDDTERIFSISISEVLVPDNIPFVLDYCYPV